MVLMTGDHDIVAEVRMKAAEDAGSSSMSENDVVLVTGGETESACS